MFKKIWHKCCRIGTKAFNIGPLKNGPIFWDTLWTSSHAATGDLVSAEAAGDPGEGEDQAVAAPHHHGHQPRHHRQPQHRL